MAAARSGTQEFDVLFGAYFFVRAVSGQVVLQIGRVGFRRTRCLSPADARLFAHTFRECAVAARRNRPEILIGAGYPRPPAAGVDEDDWFAEVNEWGAKQTWVQPVKCRPLPGWWSTTRTCSSSSRPPAALTCR